MIVTDVLVKSKQRVAEHGEVFSPAWLVEDMLDLVKDESERIDSRVLEPACGSGNFLVQVLERKLATVRTRYGRSEFETRHFALFALMCIYGIELLADNAQECRQNLVERFKEFLTVQHSDKWTRAAIAVAEVNIIHGDALTMKTSSGEPIVFPEWGYLGKGQFQRRDFRYSDLTQRASFQGTLFEQLADHSLFFPVADFAPSTVNEIGG